MDRYRQKMQTQKVDRCLDHENQRHRHHVRHRYQHQAKDPHCVLHAYQCDTAKETDCVMSPTLTNPQQGQCRLFPYLCFVKSEPPRGPIMFVVLLFFASGCAFISACNAPTSRGRMLSSNSLAAVRRHQVAESSLSKSFTWARGSGAVLARAPGAEFVYDVDLDGSLYAGRLMLPCTASLGPGMSILNLSRGQLLGCGRWRLVARR
jgi:hypothetical protein